MYQQSAILKLLNSSRVGETRQLAAKGVVCICFRGCVTPQRLPQSTTNQFSCIAHSIRARLISLTALLLSMRFYEQLWYLPLLPAPSTASGLTFNGFLPLPCGYPSCIDRLRSKTVMNPVGIHFQCLPVEKERKTRQSLKRLKRALTQTIERLAKR